MMGKLKRAISANGLRVPSGPGERWLLHAFGTLVTFMVLLAGIAVFHGTAFGDVRIPGDDASDKMESVGTLLRFIDTGLFKWGARVLAGLAILSAGWSLKEMRFGAAVISIVSAIIFGTAPTWVKNIFAMSGAESVFSRAPGRESSDFDEESRIAGSSGGPLFPLAARSEGAAALGEASFHA